MSKKLGNVNLNKDLIRLFDYGKIFNNKSFKHQEKELENSKAQKSAITNIERFVKAGWCIPDDIDLYDSFDVEDENIVKFLNEKNMYHLNNEIETIVKNLSNSKIEGLVDWSNDVIKIYNDFKNDNSKLTYLIYPFTVLLDKLSYINLKNNSTIKGKIVNFNSIGSEIELIEQEIEDKSFSAKMLDTFYLNYLKSLENLYKSFNEYESGEYNRNLAFHGKFNPKDITMKLFLQTILMCRASSERLLLI